MKNKRLLVLLVISLTFLPILNTFNPKVESIYLQTNDSEITQIAPNQGTPLHPILY